jgi:hypothetical protein
VEDMNDGNEYYIERLSENKLTDVATLHKIVYGNVLKKKYLLKKYDTAYTGAQYIGHIAYDDKNNAAAFFCAIPCFIQYHDKFFLAAQAIDAMTHPDHRYKRLFVKLVIATLELCKEKNIQLIFGFPNQNSYHGLVHTLGWKTTENMERFSVPVRTFPLQSLMHNFKWTKWVYKKYLEKILRNFFSGERGLPSSAIADGFGGVLRNEQYLQYKKYSETRVIKIGNTKVWLKMESGLVIGDIYCEENDFENAIRMVKKISKRAGITNISFQASPGTNAHNLFVQKFKAEASFPQIFYSLNTEISLNDLKFTFADIDIF